MDDYYEVLGLEPGVKEEVLKKHFRALAMEHHPDCGGDVETFNKLREAYDWVLTEIRKPQPCIGCNGEGFILRTNGFHSMKSTCARCWGSGIE